MENGKLYKQTALVTGASSGIGHAIAIQMAKEGANVIINYYNDKNSALKTKERIEQSGAKSMIIQADVSKENEVVNMFKEAIAKFGTIDILVNNAGIENNNTITKMTLEQWQRVIDINLTGQFLCAREAVREFLQRGAVDYSRATGKLIFISSVHNVIPWAGHADYAASKGAETMLMKSIAQEQASNKIRVNGIAPGAIKTDINKDVWSDPEQEKYLLNLIPYKRIGEPEDVAKVAAWLASDDADYIHGTTIYVDGGMMLYPSFAHGG